MWDQKTISHPDIEESNSEIDYVLINFIRWQVINKIDLSSMEDNNEDNNEDMMHLLNEFNDEFYTNEITE